jgi:hypothetical protein
LVSLSPYVYVREGPDIGAAVTACPAGELGLEVGKPNVVTPLAGVDTTECALFGAIDEKPGRAGLAHFPERDFLGSCHEPYVSEKVVRWLAAELSNCRSVPSVLWPQYPAPLGPFDCQ